MIIDRALIREVLHTCGAVTIVMLGIFLVGRLVGFLREAARGVIPVDSVLVMLFLKLVTYMDVILPLMLYIAVLMVLGRWNRDNEMTVIAACGIGLTHFLKPMAIVASLAVALVAGFSMYLSPLSVRVAKSLEQEFKSRSEISGVIPGVFMDTRRGDGVYFVEEYDEQADQYRNVFAYNTSFNKEGVVVAQTAFQQQDELTGDRFLVLKNGTRYEGNPGEPDYRIVEFETYTLRIAESAPPAPAIPINGHYTTTLFTADHPALKTELQWRLAKPITVPILVLFALAFSYVDARRSRLPSILLACLTYFIYTNLMAFAVGWMNNGRLAPELGLWWVHGLFLVVAMYLFRRRSRNEPVIPSLRLRPIR